MLVVDLCEAHEVQQGQAHLDQGNTKHQYKLGGVWIEMSSEKKAFFRSMQTQTQDLFCLVSLQPLCPQPVALRGVVVAKVDLAFGLAKSHSIGINPSLQSVQVPAAFQKINTPPQLSVISKFANGGLNPLI
ncbi:integral membrane protein dgcr2 idd [Willisornis vidua]|uniref:Integral membrane protein dgcr2 idd n=1 Tax=Willisornis vidua TaxID=1566151 RepID=A0ABQ9DGT1_9PASS|nr:integral membrane protein dgcr2 idd [Willisornis vidua]